MLCYPAILHAADAHGVFGCEAPDLLINASGATADAAIRDAAEIMAELLNGMAAKGEAFPDPTPADALDLDGGVLVLLTAPLPRAAA